jgi:transporter family-2 protein
VIVIIGVIFSILAGILMSLQGLFNTRASSKLGLWETTTVVHVTGLLFSLVILFFYGNANFKKLKDINIIYLLGGVIGVIIIYSVMKGISLIGITFTTAILLITQLIISTTIDYFGLFGSTPVKLDFAKVFGLVLMIIGIIIFKLK